MSLQLSVIIPVWNCWELTRNCLASLREHTPGNFMEVLVVDNGSTDETAAELPAFGKSLFAENFIYIRNNENEGFAKACNKGAEKARAEMLFFLNNDTVILKNWLAPLLAAFRNDPKLGACGPLLLYPDGKSVQHLGITFSPTLSTEHLYGNFPASHRVVNSRRHLQAITGAAFMVPKKLFEAAGRFFDGYRNGSEDLELCARITALGNALAVLPQSKIIHLESQTPGRLEHDAANAELLNKRCMGAFAPDLHKHARRDGYGIALTPWLDLFVVLQPAKEVELCKAYAPGFNGFDKDNSAIQISPGLWWEGLQEEPLWQAGYDLLGEFLEQNASYEEAAGLRLLQCCFFPLLPNFRALARMGAKIGNADLADQALQKIEHITSQIENIEILLDKGEKLGNWASRAGEKELAALYKDWREI